MSMCHWILITPDQEVEKAKKKADESIGHWSDFYINDSISIDCGCLNDSFEYLRSIQGNRDLYLLEEALPHLGVKIDIESLRNMLEARPELKMWYFCS